MPRQKKHDLLRDSRYALHSWPYPLDEQAFTDDEFYVSGEAVLLNDDTLRHTVATAIGDSVDDGVIFELALACVLHKGRDAGRAVYTRWNDR